MEFDMSSKAKDVPEPKRLNRTVGVADALKGVLDSALKKRGFATRDLLTNWAAIAPKPYDRTTVPDQLKWPRGASHEGATLYLRCMPGQALALSHEGGMIAAAVNRYFGYLLVREVRISLEPFTASSAPRPERQKVPPEVVRRAEETVAGIEDDALRNALSSLGQALHSKRPR
jgi:hypothetical protein